MYQLPQMLIPKIPILTSPILKTRYFEIHLTGSDRFRQAEAGDTSLSVLPYRVRRLPASRTAACNPLDPAALPRPTPHS